MQERSDRFVVSLSRTLGLFDVTMIGVGAMIGAGIFGLTGIAAGEAGPVGLLLAFLLNGLVTSLTGLTYAELGSAHPQAGGGYAWVKLGLSRVWGFYAGWLSWFSHSVACSLYAVLFGTFFVELLTMGGLRLSHDPLWLGMGSEALAVKLSAIAVALLFVAINIRGSSETGLIGNVITVFKIIVLGALVFFGLKAMAGMDDWAAHFLSEPSPLPKGMSGVVLAMGLTFVAFEGYEIIAQSGEEVINPERNVPRAIFGAIAVVVVIYLAVAFVSVGALVQDTGLPNWVYLGRNGERAMIETARSIMPYGALVMILGGLASTMSALNATIYSSSRVSFAMGRDHDLPSIFGRIHPSLKTPHWAVMLSGALVVFMAVALPVQDVASGASITFLLLFLMVNVSLIRLRTTHPDMPRPFRVPLVPALPILSILIQLVLAVELFQLSPIAWVVTLIWLALGIVVYRRHGGLQEAAREQDVVLFEQTTVPRGYSVLVPVGAPATAEVLTQLASLIAQVNQGEIFALHVIQVPSQMGISDGRAFLKQGRPILEQVARLGEVHDVPVRTMLRLAREVGASIIDVSRERQINLMVLGWPQHAPREAFGSMFDLISRNPPSDLAVLRYRSALPPRRLLVPIAGGPNSRLALEIALTLAEAVEARTGVASEVVGLHLIREPGADMQQAEEALRHRLDITGWPVHIDLRPADDLVQAIVDACDGFDMVVIGASEEGLLEQGLFGSIPQDVAEQAPVSVVMVKRHDEIKFGLRRWLGTKR